MIINSQFCGKSLCVPEDAAGKAGWCPECGQKIHVPPSLRTSSLHHPTVEQAIGRSAPPVRDFVPIPTFTPTKVDRHPRDEMVKKLAPLVGLLLGVALITWYFFGGGLEQQAAEDMQQIEHQVAADAVRQYEIAKRNGNAV